METQHAGDGPQEGAQRFRIERGAQVHGTDGPLGTVQQVVMDQPTGTLRSLVVRGEAGMDYELDAGYIESATGDEVRLTIGRQDLASEPGLARPYVPEQYAPVESGQVIPPGQAADTARHEEGPVLTNIEPDAVEAMTPVEASAGAASAPSTSPSALTDADWDAADAADMEDELDEADELEAVIIPGEEPGESDIFIAGSTEPPMTGPAATATEGAWLPTRGPQGADYQGPGGRSVVGMLAAAGVLLLTGGAIATYLIVRRNQQRATLGARVSQQTAAAAASAAAVRDTLWHRANTWLAAAGGALATWRHQAAARGSALSDTLRRQARQATSATSRVVGSGLPVRQMTSQLTGGAGRFGDRLASGSRLVQRQVRNSGWWQWLRAVPTTSVSAWNDLTRRATRTTQRATRQAQRTARATITQSQQVTAQANKQANRRIREARANAHRRTRRIRRRVRWFRNGMLAGVAGGILYAPRPGRDTRAVVAGWMRRIPALHSLLDVYSGPSATAGGVGPRPQTPLEADMRAAGSGSGTTPAHLGATSEQSDGLPLSPDLAPGDIAGPAI